MKKKKGFQFEVTVKQSIGVEHLYDLVMENSDEDVLAFIVGLDLAMEDWGFTEKLIAHFKALEIVMLKECDCEPVEPKKIEV